MNIVQQKIRTFRFTERLLDLFLLILALFVAITVADIYYTKIIYMYEAQSINYYGILSILCIWLVLIQIFEHDMLYRQITIWNLIRSTFIISFVGITTTITLDYLLKFEIFNRFSLTLFGLLSFSFLLLKRGGMKYFLSYIRHEGLDPKNILIVGSQRRAQRLIHEFGEHREYGIKIQGILDPDSSRIGESVDGVTVSGNISSIRKLIHDKEIDEVFFALDLNLVPNNQSIFNYLNTIGVSYHIMLNENVHRYAEKSLNIIPVTNSYYGIPMLSFQSVSANHIKLYIKNCIEKIFAFILLLLSLPILILFGIIIKCTSSGSVFFKQVRVGLHGRKFYQYKLRSMVIDADNLKDEYMHLNEQSGPVFKIKNDPRLTKVGKFMRKFSIDELPQLINILMGAMNLIGPRPPIPSEVENYKDIHFRRLSMKPGITGLWQVSGRNNIKDFDKWVELDLDYIDNWSFALDLKIALKTVCTVLSGTGS